MMACMSSAYSDEQVDRYLAHIRMPERYLRRNHPTPDPAFLHALHAHQLCTIPFENLTLHYSPAHDVDLDPQALFRKYVSARGRGGYCMENALFFNHMLRALGFHAYVAGGRVRPRTDGVPGGAYMGWVHAVNVVTFPDGARYLSDVGYGGDGPVAPLPMVAGTVTPNIGTQELRLMHESIPGQADASQKQWLYQFRNAPDRDFNTCFCFLDREFVRQDFEVMAFYTNRHPSSYMTTTAAVVRFLHRDYQVYGKRMLVNDAVKENVDGKTVVLRHLTTERERLDCLRDDFGITLMPEEQAAIYETKLALEGPAMS